MTMTKRTQDAALTVNLNGPPLAIRSNSRVHQSLIIDYICETTTEEAMQKEVPRRARTFREWRRPDTRFMVNCDIAHFLQEVSRVSKVERSASQKSFVLENAASEQDKDERRENEAARLLSTTTTKKNCYAEAAVLYLTEAKQTEEYLQHHSRRGSPCLYP